MLTREQVEVVKRHSTFIQEVVDQRTKRDDSKDIPQAVAYEAIDLIEWTVPLDLQLFVGSYMIKQDMIQGLAKGIVKRYFNIRY